MIESTAIVKAASWLDKPWYLAALKKGASAEIVAAEIQAIRQLATEKREADADAEIKGKALAERMVKVQDDWGMSNQELADLLSLDKSTVSAYMSAVREFRSSAFYPDATISDLRQAKANKRTYSGQLKETPNLNDHILAGAMAGDDARAVKRRICKAMRVEQTRKATERLKELREADDALLNRCWLGDASELATDSRLVGRVDLILWDPPYFGMRRGGNGIHTNGREAYNGLAMHAEEYCTNYDQVIEHHYNFLEKARATLAPRGRLLWFLSSLAVTDREFNRILEATYEQGWECNLPWQHWLKSKPNVCNLDAAWAHQDELVICLNISGNPEEPEYPCDYWPYDKRLDDGSYKGTSLEKFAAIHDRKSNFIPIASLTQNLAGHVGKLAEYDQNWDAWEKPVELGEYLSIKSAAPGSLVWDACGCTGNLTIGAMRAGMNFIYSERSEEKYAEGVRRIARAREELGTSQQVAGRVVED